MEALTVQYLPTKHTKHKIEHEKWTFIKHPMRIYKCTQGTEALDELVQINTIYATEIVPYMNRH